MILHIIKAHTLQQIEACTDLVERALRENSYNLKDLIDEDMKNNPGLYPHESDPNINFRRVKNVKIFFR